MAWQYHDYKTQSTPAARLERALLHDAEVRAEFGPDLTISGRSRNNQGILEYLRDLAADIRTYQTQVSSAAGGMFTRGRLL